MACFLGYRTTPGPQSVLSVLASLSLPVSLILTLVCGWLAWKFAWGGSGYAVYLYGNSLVLPIKMTTKPLTYPEADAIAQEASRALGAYRSGISEQTNDESSSPREILVAGNSITVEPTIVVSGDGPLSIANIKSVRVVRAGRLSSMSGDFWAGMWQRWLYAVAMFAVFGLLFFALNFVSFITGIISAEIEGWLFGILFITGATMLLAYYLYNILIPLSFWHIDISDGVMWRTIYKTEDKGQAQTYAELIKVVLSD